MAQTHPPDQELSLHPRGGFYSVELRHSAKHLRPYRQKLDPGCKLLRMVLPALFLIGVSNVYYLPAVSNCKGKGSR